VFDISFDKVVVIMIVAALIVGPRKLPEYATRLAQFIRRARLAIDSTQDKIKDELGPEFRDLDWKKLDPRLYDPRHIIRDSLLNDPTEHDEHRTPLNASPLTTESINADHG
jgi:sec-independent protein translocase protein TatB